MLTLTTAELNRHVSRQVGIPNDGSDDLNDGILLGLRWFYLGAGHDWTFLRKSHSATVTGGSTSITLPSDFVRLSSAVTLDGISQPLEPVASRELHTALRVEQATGEPRLFAVESEPPSTSYSLTVYPTPSQDRTIRFWYLIDPDEPTGLINPRGGSQHASCIIAACVAGVERVLQAESESAVRRMEEYEAKLAQSIQLDRQLGGRDELASQ